MKRWKRKGLMVVKFYANQIWIQKAFLFEISIKVSKHQGHSSQLLRQSSKYNQKYEDNSGLVKNKYDPSQSKYCLKTQQVQYKKNTK